MLKCEVKAAGRIYLLCSLGVMGRQLWAKSHRGYDETLGSYNAVLTPR